jgi:hypothetical protein
MPASPKTQAVKMLAMDKTGKAKLDTRDVYRERHRYNKMNRGA